MKRKGQAVEEMVMRPHYLNALEQESQAEESLSDMEREAFIETIQDLKESMRNANEMIRSLQDTVRGLQSELERSRSQADRYQSLIGDLRSVIAGLQKKLEEREKENSDLRDLNNRHNKMSLGGSHRLGV